MASAIMESDPHDFYPKITTHKSLKVLQGTLMNLVESYAPVHIIYEDHDCAPHIGSLAGKYVFQISRDMTSELRCLSHVLKNHLGRRFYFKCPVCYRPTDIPESERTSLDYDDTNDFDAHGYIEYCKMTDWIKQVDL